MNMPIHNLLTARQISETHERLAKIGTPESIARRTAQDLLILATLIEQATIPNQKWLYLCSNLEQFMMKLIAIKQTYNLTTAKVRDGLRWLKDVNLLEGDFFIPDSLLALHCEAWDMIQKRPAILLEMERTRKSREKQSKQAWQEVQQA
jgi:hypothetical protein